MVDPEQPIPPARPERVIVIGQRAGIHTAHLMAMLASIGNVVVTGSSVNRDPFEGLNAAIMNPPDLTPFATEPGKRKAQWKTETRGRTRK